MVSKVLEALECFNLSETETKRHLLNIKELTEELLKGINENTQYKLTDSYKKSILNASMLHDIGKASIPKQILYKKGVLDENERMIVETHPITGIYLLKKVLEKVELSYSEEESEIITNIILYHHERWDGSGYPNGIKGEEIPLESRIVSIVDVFDALTSDRCYKKAWSVKEALKYLEEEKGKMFDPVIVDYFIKQKRSIQEK